DLIREMSRANWLWGAPRVHGELLKPGIEVAQATVAKYMVKGPRRPGQSWRTFLRNHADGIAASDLFVVPTIGFKVLYCLVFLTHSRRELIHHAVTAHPTAECAEPVEVLHIGDYDESGESIFVVLAEDVPAWGEAAAIGFCRLAVIPAQIAELGLPTAP